MEKAFSFAYYLNRQRLFYLCNPNMIMSYLANLEMSYSKDAIMLKLKGGHYGRKIVFLDLNCCAVSFGSMSRSSYSPFIPKAWVNKVSINQLAEPVR